MRVNAHGPVRIDVQIAQHLGVVGRVEDTGCRDQCWRGVTSGPITQSDQRAGQRHSMPCQHASSIMGARHGESTWFAAPGSVVHAPPVRLAQ